MKKSLYWLALLWLRFWAQLVLWRFKPFIIGVTGSAGKTSAIAAIEPVSGLKFPRLKVARKANSESGIPADILGLHFGESASPLLDWLRICLLAPLKTFSFFIFHFSFDAYVVEMGVDEPTPPKNMEYLLTILQPDIGVILNALPVHIEQFEKAVRRSNLINYIAAEKGKLITANENLKWAILNADQREVSDTSQNNPNARKLTFGASLDAGVRVLSIKPSLEHTEIALQYNKQKHFIILKRLALPEFYSYTFAAAFAVGIALGVSPKAVVEAISGGFILPPGRGQIYDGIKGTTIIDSSYNASRVTMIGSLKLLKAIAGKRRKVAVMGDMRELGNQAKTEHEAVAKIILETADEVYLVGPLMKQYVLPILRNKLPLKWFATAGEAAKFLPEALQGNEVVLVKGSQNTIFLEIVVEALLRDKGDAEKLCRRGKFWDRQRKQYQ